MLNTLLERFAFDDVPAAARCNGPSPEPARYRRWRRHSLVAKQSFGSLERSDESRPMILPLTIERPSQIREHLGRSSNPSAHPHRSYRTLRDGAFGARCPRHCVPGYDQAVPPGHLPGALTPPDAHCTAQISYQTVSYTCGTGTLRACVPGVRAGLRSLTPPALFRSPGNFATGSFSLLEGSATREAAPGLHRGQKVCPTRAISVTLKINTPWDLRCGRGASVPSD
jgi:hypothetical protein